MCIISVFSILFQESVLNGIASAAQALNLLFDSNKSRSPDDCIRCRIHCIVILNLTLSHNSITTLITKHLLELLQKFLYYVIAFIEIHFFSNCFVSQIRFSSKVSFLICRSKESLIFFRIKTFLI